MKSGRSGGAPATEVRQIQRVALIWLLASTSVLATASLMQVRPDHGLSIGGLDSVRLPELCSSRRWFGLSCPGCGLTRSIVSAVHGRWRESWYYHPAGLCTVAILVAQLPLRLWQFATAKPGRPLIDTTVFDLILMLVWQIALLGIWIVRWSQSTLP